MQLLQSYSENLVLYTFLGSSLLHHLDQVRTMLHLLYRLQRTN